MSGFESLKTGDLVIRVRVDCSTSIIMLREELTVARTTRTQVVLVDGTRLNKKTGDTVPRRKWTSSTFYAIPGSEQMQRIEKESAARQRGAGDLSDAYIAATIRARDLYQARDLDGLLAMTGNATQDLPLDGPAGEALREDVELMQRVIEESELRGIDTVAYIVRAVREQLRRDEQFRAAEDFRDRAFATEKVKQ